MENHGLSGLQHGKPTRPETVHVHSKQQYARGKAYVTRAFALHEA